MCQSSVAAGSGLNDSVITVFLIMRLDFTGVRILAVVAHPDDAELLCAGTLARARADGKMMCSTSSTS